METEQFRGPAAIALEAEIKFQLGSCQSLPLADLPVNKCMIIQAGQMNMGGEGGLDATAPSLPCVPVAAEAGAP